MPCDKLTQLRLSELNSRGLSEKLVRFIIKWARQMRQGGSKSATSRATICCGNLVFLLEFRLAGCWSHVAQTGELFSSALDSQFPFPLNVLRFQPLAFSWLQLVSIHIDTHRWMELKPSLQFNLVPEIYGVTNRRNGQ